VATTYMEKSPRCNPTETTHDNFKEDWKEKGGLINIPCKYCKNAAIWNELPINSKVENFLNCDPSIYHKRTYKIMEKHFIDCILSIPL